MKQDIKELADAIEQAISQGRKDMSIIENEQYECAIFGRPTWYNIDTRLTMQQVRSAICELYVDYIDLCVFPFVRGCKRKDFYLETLGKIIELYRIRE
jgi:hypothetical protein